MLSITRDIVVNGTKNTKINYLLLFLEMEACVEIEKRESDDWQQRDPEMTSAFSTVAASAFPSTLVCGF